MANGDITNRIVLAVTKFVQADWQQIAVHSDPHVYVALESLHNLPMFFLIAVGLHTVVWYTPFYLLLPLHGVLDTWQIV